MEKPGVSVLYIGPFLEPYMYYRIFATETKSECIADILDYFPQNVKIPRVSSPDADTLKAWDLI